MSTREREDGGEKDVNERKGEICKRKGRKKM